MKSKELVLKYFNSWQEPADFQETADCLSENFKIDAGFFSFDNKNSLIQFFESNPAPWKNVKMLSSFFGDNFSAILYEGTNTVNNKKMRVSEHIKIENAKITEIFTVIAELN